jgi:methionine biosynthesis protein MetW
MPLSEAYSAIDRNHHGAGRKDMLIKEWPANRHEAVFYATGTGSSVLDIGCGNGFLLYNLRDKFEKLYGIELSSSMVKEAKKTLHDQQAEIYLGNVDHLSFKDEFFDCVVWTDVVEHIPDVWQAFREVVRVLRPGGQLITATSNVAYFKRRITLLRGRFPVTSGYDEGLIPGGGCDLFAGGHFHYFTFRSLRKNYEKFGIKVVREFGFGRLGRVHNLWRTMLSGGICIVGEKN